MTRSAAALVIGNEILTGKVAEANVAHLARMLFGLGIELKRVVVCSDDIEIIAADVNALRASHDLVFTSGGVGPTHDDVTIDAIAHAFGRRVARSAEVERLIREYHAQRDLPVTDAHLRLANIVEGARLVRNATVAWPTIVVDNVYVLPGVPEIFQLKLAQLRDELATDEAFVGVAVYTRCDEGDIAQLLHDLAHAHPAVTIGSYLKWRSEDYRVKITFDGRSDDDVRKAADAFIAAIGDLYVRLEPL